MERESVQASAGLEQAGRLPCVAHALTDAQAGEANTVSTLTVGGLVKHVTETQKHWLDIAAVLDAVRTLDLDTAVPVARAGQRRRGSRPGAPSP